MEGYTLINWENSPSTQTPLSAENLSHMDNGIKVAYDLIQGIRTDNILHSGAGSYDSNYNFILLDIDDFNAELVKSGDVFAVTFNTGYNIPKPGTDSLMIRINTNAMIATIINVYTNVSIVPNDVLYLIYSASNNTFIPINLILGQINTINEQLDDLMVQLIPLESRLNSLQADNIAVTGTLKYSENSLTLTTPYKGTSLPTMPFVCYGLALNNMTVVNGNSFYISADNVFAQKSITNNKINITANKFIKITVSSAGASINSVNSFYGMEPSIIQDLQDSLKSITNISRDLAELEDSVETEINDLTQRNTATEKAIAELKDKKITKFYANSLGQSTLNDSDNGTIVDMKIFGKGEQDLTDNPPSPNNPKDIKYVKFSSITICGKNIFAFNVTAYDRTAELRPNATQRLILTKINDNEIKCAYNGGNNSWGYIVIPGVDGTLNYKITYKVKENNTVYAPTLKKAVNVSSDKTKLILVAVGGNASANVSNDKYFILSNIQVEQSSVATEYAPYSGETVQLSNDLYGIPVTSGGNVTIDNQQYVSDYIDVDTQKHTHCVDMYRIQGTENIYAHSSGWIYCEISAKYKADVDILCNVALHTRDISQTTGNYIRSGSAGVYFSYNDVFKTVDDFKTYVQSNIVDVLLQLNTPMEFNEMLVLPLQSAKTQYPTTNIIIRSDSRDGLLGYSTFNYPVSMKNGWDYVKQQINDNRDYIYDMELQSLKSYINSEYAVALTELEVDNNAV